MRTACETNGHTFIRFTATSDMCSVCATTVPATLGERVPAPGERERVMRLVHAVRESEQDRYDRRYSAWVTE